MEIEKYIFQAENIFLGNGSFKDDRNERIDFIKNLETCDLIAVPGSGKTTALIAKLYCIAQNMPFEDGGGILVLAHTNNAVEEIEKKLKRHCPQLFEYPNFVGTIQSFVNRYLANQACFEKYGNYIRKNEDEIPSKKMISMLKSLPKYGNPLMKYFFSQIYPKYAQLKVNEFKENLNIDLKEAKLIVKTLKALKILDKKNILSYYKVKEIDSVSTVDGNVKEFLKQLNSKAIKKVEEEKYEKALYYRLDFINNRFVNDNSNFSFEKDSGKILLEKYEILFKDGALRFNDSFSFAERFLKDFPQIKNFMQKRFKYVFIDEMQDLEGYQIKILDEIFFTKNSKTIIQRIGDKNQSIYNSGKTIKAACDWKTREESNNKIYKDLSFQNSLRLNSHVANLVDKFVLERPEHYKVVGKFDESNLEPHLIIINRNTTGDQLYNKFEELIKVNNLHQCEKNLKNGFKIVSWVTEKEEDNDEIYLQKLFSNYSKRNHSPKEDYNCLKDYLYYYDNKKKTLKSIRKSILNCLIRILDIEDIKDKNERRYRKSSLMEFIKNQGEEYYDGFKAKLYLWCSRIVLHQQNEEVYSEIVSFVKSKEFIGLNWRNLENYVSCTISKSNQFIISSDFQLRAQNKEVPKQKEDIQIELASVHAVKGQTHCATMYIESYFHNYELNKKKVRECIQGKEHNIQKDKNISQAVQALKMMYVGFSRPTHLLCFAVLKENIGESVDNLKIENGGMWKVVEDLIDNQTITQK